MQKINIDKQELEFSFNENIWFCPIEKENGQIEISIDIEKYNRAIDWSKIKDFITYFMKNERSFLKKCYEPLKTLAKTTTFFSDEAIQSGEFLFSEVEILDNQFSLDGNWDFELKFEFLDTDPYGLWIISFYQNCIVGVRREQR